jgi:hypothetical protein
MDSETQGPDEYTPEEEFITGLLLDVRNSDHRDASEAVPDSDVSRVVQYLSGVLAAPEADDFVRQCNDSQSVRRRLLEVDSLLLEIRELPWDSAESLATGEGLRSEIAKAWLTICRKRIPEVSQAVSQRRTETWAEMQRSVREGVEEALAAAAAFGSFARQFRDRLRSPALAFSRGSVSDALALVIDPPAGVEIEVREAAITPEGAFSALIVASAPPGSESPVDGLTVYIDLTDGNTYRTLGAAAFAGMTAVLTVADVGTSLGLAAGALPDSAIRVRFGNSSASLPKPSIEHPWTLPARVSQLPVLNQRYESPIPNTGNYGIEIVGIPQWFNGHFTVDVRLPQTVRELFPWGELLLDVTVTESISMNIGAWEIAGWTDAPRTLSASCPSAADCELSDSSCLNARIIG